MPVLFPEDRDTIVALAEVWMVTDTNRCFLAVAPRLLELLGYASEEMVGHHYSEFIHPGDLVVTRRAGDILSAAKLVDNVVVRYLRRAGGYRWLEFRCLATTDGGRRVCVGRDITHRKQLEATAAANRATLSEHATTDYLSGLLNKRSFIDAMVAELARSRRHLRSVSLVSLDIDHFKRLNDTLGHDAGDAAIRAVSQLLRGTSRQEDLVFRVGGEEFAMLLMDCGQDEAVIRATSALKSVRDMRPTYLATPLPPITLSAGVASYPDHGEDWPQLVRAADAALYVSKHSGRDRVSVAEVSHG